MCVDVSFFTEAGLFDHAIIEHPSKVPESRDTQVWKNFVAEASTKEYA
jgi:hypothetical protein